MKEQIHAELLTLETLVNSIGSTVPALLLQTSTKAVQIESDGDKTETTKLRTMTKKPSATLQVQCLMNNVIYLISTYYDFVI